MSRILYSTLFRSSALVLVAALLNACSGDPRPLQEAVEAEQAGLARLTIESDQSVQDQTVINPRQSVQFSFKAFDQDNNEILLPNSDRRWSVSDYDVADITDSGLLTGKFDGVVTVGLRIAGIVAEPVSLRVSSAELLALDGITGEDVLTECSVSRAYTATGTFTDQSVRQLDNLEWRVSGASGRLLDADSTEAVVGALAPGSITLIASSDGIEGAYIITVEQGIASLTILPQAIEIERNANLSLVARADYSAESKSSQNVTALASWSVDQNSDIATVQDEDGKKGILRGVQLGQTQVHAECAGTGVSADVTVIEPQNIVGLRIEPDDDPIELFVNGADLQLKVFALSSGGSDEEVTDRATWQIKSGEDIVAVDNSTTSGGLLTPLKAGEASLEVSYSEVSQTVSVVVR